MGAENHSEIADRAAAWLARRDSGHWSSEDEARFREWIEASDAHRVGYLRLETAWMQARRLKALGAGLPSGSVPPRERWHDTPFFAVRSAAGAAGTPDHAEFGSQAPDPQRPPRGPARRRAAEGPRASFRRSTRFAAAASILAIVAATLLILHGIRGRQYSTALGSIASVPLEDGSEVTLDTASRIRVELGRAERRVDLIGGEAFFVVAKDARRPFIVEANGERVVAVGTQFSVRREPRELKVAVMEGVVRLEGVSWLRDRRGRSACVLPPDGAAPVVLTAGSVARIEDGAACIEKEPLPQLEAALSWRRGYLTFREATLAEVAAEFNRYNSRKISITDPSIAAIRISGTFRPTHPRAFVRLLAEGFPIRAIESGDAVTLVASAQPAGAAAP
jgi:transmembrane sensor